MIEPTIGRIVWYTPAPNSPEDFSDQKLAAIVTYVHSNNMVNLAVFDSNGNSHSRRSISLLQDDETETQGPYCEWMPFQKGQAARYDKELPAQPNKLG